jgi:hypothetical protein
MSVSPPKVYEVNGQVCKVLSAFEASGSTGNKLLVAAATGKVHRVMGWIAQGGTATRSDFRLRTAVAGNYLMAPLRVPGNNDIVSADRQDLTDSGYMETNVGDALYADVTNASINLTVFYITYTP